MPNQAKRRTRSRRVRRMNRNEADPFRDASPGKMLPYKPMEPVFHQRHGWGQRMILSLPVAEARNWIGHPTIQSTALFSSPSGGPGALLSDSGASLPLNPKALGGQAGQFAQFYERFRMVRFKLQYLSGTSNMTGGQFTLAYLSDVSEVLPTSTVPEQANYSGQLSMLQNSCVGKASANCDLETKLDDPDNQLYYTDLGSNASSSDYRLAYHGKIAGLNQTQSTEMGTAIFNIGRFVLHAVIDYYVPTFLRTLLPDDEQKAYDQKLRKELSLAFVAKNNIPSDRKTTANIDQAVSQFETLRDVIRQSSDTRASSIVDVPPWQPHGSQRTR